MIELMSSFRSTPAFDSAKVEAYRLRGMELQRELAQVEQDLARELAKGEIKQPEERDSTITMPARRY